MYKYNITLIICSSTKQGLHFAASEIEKDEEDEDKQEEEDEHIVQDIVQHVEAEKRKPEMAVQPQKRRRRCRLRRKRRQCSR